MVAWSSSLSLSAVCTLAALLTISAFSSRHLRARRDSLSVGGVGGGQRSRGVGLGGRGKGGQGGRGVQKQGARGGRLLSSTTFYCWWWTVGTVFVGGGGGRRGRGRGTKCCLVSLQLLGVEPWGPGEPWMELLCCGKVHASIPCCCCCCCDCHGPGGKPQQGWQGVAGNRAAGAAAAGPASHAMTCSQLLHTHNLWPLAAACACQQACGCWVMCCAQVHAGTRSGCGVGGTCGQHLCCCWAMGTTAPKLLVSRVTHRVTFSAP
jgi:hypothetical protein